MNIYLLIFFMMVVTYIPRALPALNGEKMRLSPFWERFLSLIPYTALAALIFPGALNVVPFRPAVGLVGLAAACAASFYKLPTALVIAAGVLASAVVYWIG